MNGWKRKHLVSTDIKFKLMPIHSKCISALEICVEKLDDASVDSMSYIKRHTHFSFKCYDMGNFIIEHASSHRTTQPALGSILNSTTHASQPTTYALQVGLLTSQQCFVTGYNKLTSQNSNILLPCSMESNTNVRRLCAHYSAWSWRYLLI
jgi:hypothetical protein